MTIAIERTARIQVDETFDRLARLAAKAVGSSAAFVSLADSCADELVFAGLTGLPEVEPGEQTKLSGTICRHVVASGKPLVVAETKSHPLAQGEQQLQLLGIGAYLGVPLRTEEGKVVGALCLVERHPREWTQTQVEIAEGLAAAVMTEIGLRTTIAAAARQAEERLAMVSELADAEARYRTLIENIPLVTYMNSIDEPFRTLYTSPQIESLLGYSVEEWHANPELAREGVHPDDRERVRQLARDGRRLGIPTRSEFRFHARDGRVVWVLDQTIPLRDASGSIVCHQGFLLDITEQKELEELLRQSQKMEAIGQLAGGIAHDFNNMLTAITGYAELLGYSFDEGDPRLEDVAELKHAANHAANLTRQLLAFSRKQMLLPQRLDVNEILSELEPFLCRTLGEEIAVSIRLDPGLAAVEADPDQLTQVVLNIALNARDAMPGGGRLRISTATATFADEPHVAIQLSDTGTGMDAVTLERIFEPFFTTKETGKGTGLGLATVYGVVRQSGGQIEVESEVGGGSTFRVLLPQAPLLNGSAAA